MKKILLSNISTIYTFNDEEQILQNSSIMIEGRKISKIGKDMKVTLEDTEVIDCTGLVALPGFVNTHHHLYQTLFRGIKEVQEKPLFPG